MMSICGMKQIIESFILFQCILDLTFQFLVSFFNLVHFLLVLFRLLL